MVTVQLGIYASPRYLISTPPLRAPQDLAQHSCITLINSSSGTKWTLYKDRKSSETFIRGIIAIGDPVIHQQLCLDGVGIAILPKWLVSEKGQKQGLLRVLTEWTPSPIELQVLYPTRLSMTPKLRAFLAFIEEVMPRS